MAVVGELQALVERLAARLGRPVVLEDRRQRLLAYSQHDEPLDPVRRETILQRQTTPEVIAYLRGFGITTATGAVRIPGEPDLGLDARVCIPLRHAEVLLGFLWFVDADGTMPDAEVAVARDAGGELTLALYRENLLGELAGRGEREALRNLLVSDPLARQTAARQLVESGALPADAPVTALVAQPVRAAAPVPDAELLGLAVEQALVQVRRALPPRRALHLVRFDHGLLVLAGASRSADASRSPGSLPPGSLPPGSGDDGTGPTAVGRRLVPALTRALVGLTGTTGAVVGVGEPVDALTDLVHSEEQARLAARVATSVPGVGPLALWRGLGVYRALAQLSAEQLGTGQLGAGVLHPGLAQLLAVDDDQRLAHTLETYLDLAGNAQATARALTIHRATLYHRLQRIEAVADADLRDGADRLALHLGLKLARLTGHYGS